MDFYKKLFEKTGQAAIFVDAAFDICEFNDAAVQMFGSDIAIGVSFNEVANLSYVDKIDKTVLKELKKMGSWKGMVSSFSPNQRISMLIAEYHRVADEVAKNEPHYVLMFQSLELNRDLISSLMDQQHQYRSFFEALTVGIVVQTKQNEIILCNSAAENILGLTKNQMLGLTSIDPSWHCIHEDGSEFPGQTHPAMVCFNTGKPVRNIIMGVYKPDNRISWIIINSEPIFERTSSLPVSVITSFRDVTEKKEYDQYILKHFQN